MRLYVDLDGVLCDFEGRVAAIMQLPFHTLTRPQIWEALAKDEEFYLNLPWMKDGPELWRAVKHLDPWILSACSSHVPLSTNHKYIWCTRELDIDVEKIVVVPHKTDKQKFAEGNYLLDDSEKNVLEWKAAGGEAYLYKGDMNAALRHLLVEFGELPQ